LAFALTVPGMNTLEAVLDDTASPVEYSDEVARHDRALSAGHALWKAMKASPELFRIGAIAASRTVKGPDNRGSGERFEAKFCPLLTDEVQATITADVVAALPDGIIPGLGRVREILWLPSPAGSRALLDCIVQTTTVAGAVRRDWVNVKQVGKSQAGEACAQSTIERVALGEDLTIPRRVKVARTVVQFAAGTLKIATDDYIIVDFMCAGKKLLSIHAQGLLSTVTRDKLGMYRLAMYKHSNRGVQQCIPSDIRLPDDFDVNAAFWRSLIRPLKADDLRLHYVTLAAQSDLTPAQVTAVAAAVDGMDDETMFAIARSDFEKICPDLRKA